MTRRTALLFCSMLVAFSCCFAQNAKISPGSISGEVFNTSADGQRAVVPGAHISLSGPVERQMESDAMGQYRFEQLPAGKYGVEATAPGMAGTVTVDVAVGQTATAPISL